MAKHATAVWELCDYEYRPFGRTGKALYFTLTSARVPADININKELDANSRDKIEAVSIPRCVCYREDNGVLHVRGPSYNTNNKWIMPIPFSAALKRRLLDMIQTQGLDEAIGLEAIAPL
jgi:hypothetical protein